MCGLLVLVCLLCRVLAQSRAQLAWNALVKNLSSNRTGIFIELLGSPQLAYEWPHSQILHAAIDLSLQQNNSELDDILIGLGRYAEAGAYTTVVDPPPLSPHFWDDNGVTSLALIQAALSLGVGFWPQVLQLWPFISKGLNSTEGGVYWYEGDPSPQRGLSATGSNTEVALWLYRLTGESQYLDFALLNLRWLDSHLRAPEGYYFNSWYDNPNHNPCGPAANSSLPPNVCTWMFTYNQGMVIGAQVLLFRILKSTLSLDNATQIALSSLDFFTADLLWKQPPPFNAIFFRNLLCLDAVAPNPRYRQVFQDYLDRVWSYALNETTGLFTEGGIGTYEPSFGSIDQAAFVQMYALSTWPVTDFSIVT